MKKYKIWIPYFGIFQKKANDYAFNNFWVTYQIISSVILIVSICYFLLTV